MSTEVDPEKINLLNEDGDNPGDDEAGEQFEMKDFNKETSTSSGSVDPTSSNKKRETPFGGETSGTKSLLAREENLDEALAKIHKEFPNYDPANSSFTHSLDEFGQVIVRLKTEKAINHVLIDVYGNINEKIIRTSKKIKASLGARAEKVVENNEEEIARRKKK